jgi:hypothetical protein
LEEDEPDLETAFKVVAIMQTIAEDLDESSKRMWRKMLGLSDETRTSPKDAEKQSPKNNPE